jgi:hypothetical protein
MGEASFVHRNEGAKNLACDLLCLVFGNRSDVCKVGFQVTVFAVLHSDVKPPDAFVPTVRFDEELCILPA